MVTPVVASQAPSSGSPPIDMKGYYRHESEEGSNGTPQPLSGAHSFSKPAMDSSMGRGSPVVAIPMTRVVRAQSPLQKQGDVPLCQLSQQMQ